MNTDRPLEGIRIIDFCWVGAGSYTTKILADLGADVIKIESNAKVDGIRMSGPFANGIPGINRSGYFADRNTSKRSITMNMKTDRAQELARALIAEADVVTNSFTPRVMEKFGLGAEDALALNPRIVFVGMSMHGSTGPDRDAPGYGLTISALTGLHHMSGIPGKLAAGTGTNYPDHIPNPGHAAFAILAALRHARRTGKGQFIDISQTEATIPLLGPAMLERSINGVDRGPMANRHDRYAPHGLFQTAGEDRWVAIAVTADDQWPMLVKTLGLDPSQLDPEWAVEKARKRDEDRIEELIANAVQNRSAQDVFLELQGVGVPAGVVHDAKGVVAEDVQLDHRGHWIRLDHVEMGETMYNALPFRMSATPSRIERPAPMLGEHTQEIAEVLLGLGEGEIDRLREEKVLW
jgi:benzylsuccinate CoA-transferase BbsF subunit